MIVVTHLEKNGETQMVDIRGHANSAPKGESVICAAVSTLAEHSEFMLARIGALKDGGPWSVMKEDGVHRFTTSIKQVDNPSLDDANIHKFILESLVLALRGLSRDYPKNISINVV